MKKTLILFAAIIAGAVTAAEWKAYDMASYGTTATVTNTSSFGKKTLTYALVTHDAATTNTVTVYAKKGGIQYSLGSASVSNATYASIDLTDITYEPGDAIVITTTDTNVNVLVKSE